MHAHMHRTLTALGLMALTAYGIHTGTPLLSIGAFLLLALIL